MCSNYTNLIEKYFITTAGFDNEKTPVMLQKFNFILLKSDNIYIITGMQNELNLTYSSVKIQGLSNNK